GLARAERAETAETAERVNNPPRCIAVCRSRSHLSALSALSALSVLSIPPQISLNLPRTHLQVVLQHLVPLGLEEPLGQVLPQRLLDHIVLLEHLQRLVQVAR